jgi:hypothetical protein
MKLLHVEISNTGLAEFSAVLGAPCDSTLETVALMEAKEEEEEENASRLAVVRSTDACMHAYALQQR